MSNKLYVGNLNYETKESDLVRVFEKFGEIKSVTLITDKFSGISKGFGFVEMASSSDAEKALAANGSELMSRTITVSEARPQANKFQKNSTGRHKFRRRY